MRHDPLQQHLGATSTGTRDRGQNISGTRLRLALARTIRTGKRCRLADCGRCRPPSIVIRVVFPGGRRSRPRKTAHLALSQRAIVQKCASRALPLLRNASLNGSNRHTRIEKPSVRSRWRPHLLRRRRRGRFRGCLRLARDTACNLEKYPRMIMISSRMQATRATTMRATKE